MKSIITYPVALDYVLTHCELPENIAERLTALKASVEKRNASHGSDEAKAKQAEKRKAETAKARAELVATVAPILRDELSHFPRGCTAKELYENVKEMLPLDFSAPKVQNILLREMASEVVKIDNGRNPNTYALRG